MNLKLPSRALRKRQASEANRANTMTIDPPAIDNEFLGFAALRYCTYLLKKQKVFKNGEEEKSHPGNQ